jgi:hypothetical protein
MSEPKTPDQIKFPAPKTLRPPKNLLNHISALQAHAGLIPARRPHIGFMTQWQKTPRQPPKTKAELREMLTEAVRNTQSEPKRRPKAKKDRD